MTTSPIRPDKVSFFRPMSSEDQGGDLQQLLAFGFIFLGLFIKNKYTVWVALMLFMSSMFVMNSRSDSKQVVLTLGLVLMGLTSSYLSPTPA